LLCRKQRLDAPIPASSDGNLIWSDKSKLPSISKARKLVIELLSFQEVHRQTVGGFKPLSHLRLPDHINDVLPFRTTCPRRSGANTT
jgi:hypothetical protein